MAGRGDPRTSTPATQKTGSARGTSGRTIAILIAVIVLIVLVGWWWGGTGRQDTAVAPVEPLSPGVPAAPVQ